MRDFWNWLLARDEFREAEARRNREIAKRAYDEIHEDVLRAKSRDLAAPRRNNQEGTWKMIEDSSRPRDGALLKTHREETPLADAISLLRTQLASLEADIQSEELELARRAALLAEKRLVEREFASALRQLEPPDELESKLEALGRELGTPLEALELEEGGLFPEAFGRKPTFEDSTMAQAEGTPWFKLPRVQEETRSAVAEAAPK